MLSIFKTDMDHHYLLSIYASVVRTAVDRRLGSAVFAVDADGLRTS